MCAKRSGLFRGLGDPRSVCSGLYGLANLALARGDRDGAMGLLGEGEALSRETGDWAMLANFLGTQAISVRLEGDDARTTELLRESIGIAGMLRDDYNVVFGAADALGERTGAGVSWSVLRGLNEHDLATARESLDPETFEQAWTEGGDMTPEEAVAYAHSEEDASSRPRS